MESNGHSGRVMVSEDTMKLLEGAFPEKYIFMYNTEVTVSDRVYKTYFAEYNMLDSPK